MHGANAVSRRPTLLTIPALGEASDHASEAPASPAPAQPLDSGKGAAAAFYLILFSILAALVLGIFIPA
ncbi:MULTISPECIES: hypothetical protein [Rhodomicrobium]|uniref:hypothetical protein n=1 Tax=Rhodomicrobium TaxID=1068 RepID=UPI000B4C0015|nr:MULTISPECIES: hypothetical protein [Rhodomicrobium]